MEVVVGRIGRPHGLRGEVTVQVTTDDPDERFASGAVLGTDPAGRGPLTVVSMRRSGPVLVLGFDGVADRNAAEALRGTSLTLDASLLPVPDDPEEFYDHQLVGLTVVDQAGTVLGTVTEVWHPPAAPVLAVEPAGRLPGTGAVRLRDRADRRPRGRPVGRRPAGRNVRRPRGTRSSQCGSASSRSSPATSIRCGNRCWARRLPMTSSSWRFATCGTGPPTGTAPSTTRRTAAAPGW